MVASPSPDSTPKVSAKKLEANRVNAKKSTGPKTPDGKAASALNAVSHGLFSSAAVLPFEDEGQFHDFEEKLIADLRPRGMLQRVLAQRIVSLSWKLLVRLPEAEGQLAMEEDEKRMELWGRQSALDRSMGMKNLGVPPDELEPAEFIVGQMRQEKHIPLERLWTLELKLDRALQALIKQLKKLQEQEGSDEEMGSGGDGVSDAGLAASLATRSAENEGRGSGVAGEEKNEPTSMNKTNPESQRECRK